MSSIENKIIVTVEKPKLKRNEPKIPIISPLITSHKTTIPEKETAKIFTNNKEKEIERNIK
jgi:hypothetical protein